MIKTFATCLAAAALTFSFTTASSAQSQEMPSIEINDRWPQGSIDWNRGRGAVNYAIAPLTDNAGNLILCGAIQFTGGTKRGLATAVIREMQFEINGRRVVKNFSWMPVVTSGKSLVGEDAGCRLYPSVKVPENPNFDLSLAKTRF